MFGIFRLGGRMFNDLESTIRLAGWSLAGFRVMFLLWVGGPMESHEIARLAGLSRAAISSAVNTLERDGLVDRRRESDDRRVVTVYLTDDGAERLEAAYRAQNAEGAPRRVGCRRALDAHRLDATGVEHSYRRWIRRRAEPCLAAQGTANGSTTSTVAVTPIIV